MFEQKQVSCDATSEPVSSKSVLEFSWSTPWRGGAAAHDQQSQKHCQPSTHAETHFTV
jgi:hypothetical protein